MPALVNIYIRERGYVLADVLRVVFRRMRFNFVGAVGPVGPKSALGDVLNMHNFKFT